MEQKQIAKALIEAQKQMGTARKDSNNPFFKSKYADLNSVREACIPALNENGIVVLQPICQIDSNNFVKTILLHESGETIESLTQIIYSKQNDAQAQGSGITYARRYGLQSLVCIGAEDDDGNAASSRLSNSADQDMIDTLYLYLSQCLDGCDSIEDLESLKEDKDFKKSLSNLNRKDKDKYNLIIQKATEYKQSFEQIESE